MSKVLTFILLAFAGVLLSAAPASAQLTITKKTWNVIGLDSNNVAVGPNLWPVGVRVCNTSGGAYTNVTTTFTWDSANAYITLGNSATINRGTLAANTCADFYYYVTITRNAAAYFTTRNYHITASADGQASVQTPNGRQLYVEKIISQGRNTVTSITGPTNVLIGSTYTYTFKASTSTTYEQVDTPLTLDPTIFQIQSIQTTYSSGVSPVTGMYNDACGWIDDPANPNYRSCGGVGKAGNTIVSTVVVKILAGGAATLNGIINDFSGSSYHYNSDYGGVPLNVTAASPTADLQITKTDGVTNVTVGGTTTYTIVAKNAGPDAADGATVTDAAVANFSKSSVSCSAAGGAACPASVTVAGLEAGLTIPTFPNGGTVTFTVAGNVTGIAAATIANTATIAVPAGVTESNAANNTATDTDTIDAALGTADLSITKTDGVASVAPNGTVTYTIVVTNNGPDAANNSVVTDPAVTGITKNSVSCLAANGAVCPAVSVAGLEAGLTIATLPNTGTITLTVGATVTAGNGSVTNTATVAAPAGYADNNSANNTASDTDTISATTDLSITKTDSVASVTAGNTTTYTIVVTNNGPSSANNATVTDAAATGLSKFSVSCSASGGAACPSLPTVSDLESGMTIPTLPNGGSVTLTVGVSITAVGGSVTNTASVAVPAGVSDSNAGNNSASDTDTVTPSADLSVTKTNGVTSLTSGSTTTYTIVVTNSGPSGANGATVTDPAASGLDKTSVSCSAAGGAACPATLTTAGLESGLTIPTLPKNGSITLTVTANVIAKSGNVANIVTVATPGGTTDPDNSNNTATDTDSIGSGADLAVTKTNGVTSVTSGGTTTYTIVATNYGPSGADGATIKDAAATGLTKTSVTCSVVGGAQCPTSLTVAALEAGVAIPVMPNGSSVTLTVVATVTATSGSVANTATVTAPNGVTDPTPGNNTATDTDTVIVPAGPAADLRISITDGVDAVTPGYTARYSVVVTNAGPSAADGSIVTNPAPAGLTFTSVTCVASGGAVCPAGLTLAAWQAGVTIPTFPNGGVLTFTVVANVTALSGSIANTATVAAPATVTDPTPGNNTATDVDTIGGVADIQITKSNGRTQVESGLKTTYSVVVTNNGPAAAGGVVVTDAQPTGLTFTNVTCAATNGAVCPAVTVSSLGSGVTVSTFPSGGVVTFTVDADVTATSGTVSNTARVTLPAGLTDPDPTNNSATDTDEVLTQRIGVAKSIGEVLLVGPAAFEVPVTITLRNLGAIKATNVQITDALDQNFTAGSPTFAITKAPAATPTGGANADQCVAASGFTGTGSNTTLLSGNTFLLPTQGCTVTFTAKVTYASEDKIPTTTQTNSAVGRTYQSPGVGPIATDNSDSGTDPAGTNPGAPGDTGGSNDPTPVPFLLPKLTFNKALVSVTQVDMAAFDVRYKFTVRNTSQTVARNVQFSDDLTATFSLGAPTLTVTNGPVVDAGTATVTPASGAQAYNGTTRPAFFVGSDTIKAGEYRDLFLTVRVKYPSAAAIPIGVEQKNTAYATLAATPGGTPIKSYVSDDTTVSGEKVAGPSGARATIAVLQPAAKISIAKTAATGLVEVGDTMRYSIRIVNSVGAYLPAMTIQDRPALGFSFVPGSARLTVGSNTTTLADPKKSSGLLVFTVPATSGASEATLSYRMRVGPGAMQGDGTNRAVALLPDGTTTPESVARVRVTGGVFTEQACIIGKVFVDRNNNGVQDHDPVEPGVAGATLYLENGTSITTDDAGNYSLCGLPSGTHVLKIDEFTLPQGVRPVVSSSRNALDPATMFLDLVFGDMRRADVVLEPVSNDVVTPLLAELAARTAAVQTGAFDVEASVVAAPAAAIGSARVPTGATSATPTTVVIDNVTGRLPRAVITDATAETPAAPASVPAAVAATAPAMRGVMPSASMQRPLLASGLVEGIVALSSVKGPGLTPTRPNEVFETDLRKITHLFNDDRALLAARTAMFAQGTIGGDVLLTLSLDTERSKTGVLFRDIQPNAFYPIYGDASQKRFEAQTSGPVYFRAQQRKNYVMFGDINTGAASPSRSLGVYARTLTGAKAYAEGAPGHVMAFGARDTLRQVVDEVGALGVSGPYSVSNPNGVSGTEKVELITRDREQPAVILSVRPMTRFIDYQFEPFSGRLVFTSPVPSMDERLNPVSIRVTYEVDAGGEQHWVAGADAAVKLGDQVEVGASIAHDDSASSPYGLASVNATVRFAPSTILTAEAARSNGTINTNAFNALSTAALAGVSGDISGAAARVEMRHSSDRVEAQAFFGRSDVRFYNPAATLNGGRQEAGARASLSFTDTTRLRAEWMSSEDRVNGGTRNGGTIAIESRVKSAVFELGVRRVNESVFAANPAAAGTASPFGLTSGAGYGFNATTGPIDPTTGRPLVNAGATPLLNSAAGTRTLGAPLDATTLRAQVTWRMAERLATYAEAEQDLSTSSKHMAAIGGEYHPIERGRFYLRHEFNAGLSGMYQATDSTKTQRTVFGLSTAAPADGDLFSEFRLNEGMSGREAMAAIGLRNNWTLAKGLRLNTGIERLNPVASVGSAATALSLGGDYTRSSSFKATSRIEWRRDGSADAWLSTSGLALRLSSNWTALAQNYFQQRDPNVGATQSQERFWIGAAYRDGDTNRKNWLSRYEYKFERLPDAGGVAGLSERSVKIVSTHGDYKPSSRWLLFGQYAGKWATETGDGQTTSYAAHLVSARAGVDLTSRFDFGVLTSLTWSGSDNRARKAIGAEIGALIKANVWFSLGFNAVGFSDRDFNDVVSTTATTRGFFVRLRMKFDESLWGGARK